MIVALEKNDPNFQMNLGKVDFSNVMKESRAHRLETEIEVALLAEEAEDLSEALWLL